MSLVTKYSESPIKLMENQKLVEIEFPETATEIIGLKTDNLTKIDVSKCSKDFISSVKSNYSGKTNNVGGNISVINQYEITHIQYLDRTRTELNLSGTVDISSLNNYQNIVAISFGNTVTKVTCQNSRAHTNNLHHVYFKSGTNLSPDSDLSVINEGVLYELRVPHLDFNNLKKMLRIKQYNITNFTIPRIYVDGTYIGKTGFRVEDKGYDSDDENYWSNLIYNNKVLIYGTNENYRITSIDIAGDIGSSLEISGFDPTQK